MTGDGTNRPDWERTEDGTTVPGRGGPAMKALLCGLTAKYCELFCHLGAIKKRKRFQKKVF